MTTATVDLGTIPSYWNRRHLLGLEDLSAEEITLILDKAEVFRRAADEKGDRSNLCAAPGGPFRQIGPVPFSTAAPRQDVRQPVLRELDPHAEQLFAGRPAAGGRHARFLRLHQQPVEGRNVHRHGQEHRGDGRRSGGGAASHARHARTCWPRISAAAVINAGDGAHEHPTQGLLDIMTIRQRQGRLDGLTVALVGDIAHSRTARSNIWGLKKLGANVIVCGPSTLVSPRWAELGVEYSYSLDEILPRVDVLNLLRIQFERQTTPTVPLGPRIRPPLRDESPAAGQGEARRIDHRPPGRSIAGSRLRPRWPTGRTRRSWSRSPTAWRCGWR